jgi:hypothetical protein
MKKLLVVGLISSLFSAGAFAAACTATATVSVNPPIAAGSATAPAAGENCVCDGGAAGKSTVNGGSGTVVTLANVIFVKNGFDVQCSSNTIVSYNEISGTAFAVASGSKKGNQSFIGASNGGAVTTSAKCTGTNDACTGANVSTANGLATTAASSN